MRKEDKTKKLIGSPETTVKPLFDTKDEKPEHDPRLVWLSTLDARYQIEVHRQEETTSEDGEAANTAKIPSHLGTLNIFDLNNENELLLREQVGLSYNALFGPDVDDIADWQERAVKFVDEKLPKQNN